MENLVATTATNATYMYLTARYRAVLESVAVVAVGVAIDDTATLKEGFPVSKLCTGSSVKGVRQCTTITIYPHLVFTADPLIPLQTALLIV